MVQKNELLSFLTILFFSLLFFSCTQNNKSKIIIKPYNITGLDTLSTSSGLKYVLIKSNPKGLLPQKNKQVKVHYTGFFENGRIFDSSVQRGEPLTFTIGVGQVIKGWDEGIALLHQGEQARFIIPYNLAYGIEGSGAIPPMTTLVFDVELIAVTE
jgi:FKBP-type peptidyl-prolyl cis-trans isomerase